jgi:hypothetical protein
VPDIEVEVAAESTGEDVYDAHAEGIRRVAGATRQASLETAGGTSSFGSMRSTLTGLSLTLGVAGRAMRMFGVQNEALAGTLEAMAIGLGLARAALSLYRSETIRSTIANWGLASSKVAASTWAAPILVGIIAAAVAAIWAMSASPAATGLETVVTGPRLFMAGEGGPEVVRITPVGMASGGTAIGPVVVNVYTSNPDAAGRAVADYLLTLANRGVISGR